MWETSRPLSFAVAAYAIAASVLPNLVLIAEPPPPRRALLPIRRCEQLELDVAGGG